MSARQSDDLMDGQEGRSEGRGGRAPFDKKKKRAKKKTMFRKRRPPITLTFDYKDISRLVPFLTDEGKVVAARVSGLRAFQQRQLNVAVKRARHIGFLSPITRDVIY